MELLKYIKDTPIPTLLLVIGIIALSVGFGLRIRAAIDVDNVNRTYAKIIGVVFIVLGLVPYLFGISKTIKSTQADVTDPFLIYYIVSVVICIVIFFTLVSKFTSGKNQVRSLKISFIFIAAIITFVVLWRLMDIIAFINSTDKNTIPMGLYVRSNFVAYLVLLSSGFGLIVWLLYINTRQSENSENRIPIFRNFSIFCVYLVVCRLAWEVVDYSAKIKVPASSILGGS